MNKLLHKLFSSEDFFNISFIIIVTMGAFGVMGGGILAAGLPNLSRVFSVSQNQVGLVLSVYTLAAALTLPFTGLLIDLLGRKKTGLICLMIDGTFGLLCIIAPNFRFLLLFRFIQGIGIAGLIPVAMTIISDWFTAEKRLKAMGLLSGTISLSAVIIPFLGGVLASISWKLPFLIYGFSIFLAILFFIYIKESSHLTAKERKINFNNIKNYFSDLSKAIQIKKVQEVFIHSLVIYFLLYTLVTFLPIFLAEFHNLNEFWAGTALSIQGFFAAFIASQADKINIYLDWRKKLYFGFSILALALFTVPIWNNRYTVLISVLLFGIAMGVIQPAIYNRATTSAPDNQTGAVISLFNTMKFVGMSLAPFSLGLIYSAYSLNTVFTFAGFIPLTWVAILKFYN